MSRYTVSDLSQAIINKQVAVVEAILIAQPELLEQKIHAEGHEQNALQLACRVGITPIVELILKHAKPTIVTELITEADDNELHSLKLAVMHANATVVRLLCQYCDKDKLPALYGSADEPEKSLLNLAVLNNDLATVKTIVEFQDAELTRRLVLNLNEQNQPRYTANGKPDKYKYERIVLFNAAERFDSSIFVFLLDQFSHKPEKQQKNIRVVNDGIYMNNVISLLCLTDSSGRTLLHKAAQYAEPHTIAQLIYLVRGLKNAEEDRDFEEDVLTAIDHFGQMPYHIATRYREQINFAQLVPTRYKHVLSQAGGKSEIGSSVSDTTLTKRINKFITSAPAEYARCDADSSCRDITLDNQNSLLRFCIDEGNPDAIKGILAAWYPQDVEAELTASICHTHNGTLLSLAASRSAATLATVLKFLSPDKARAEITTKKYGPDKDMDLLQYVHVYFRQHLSEQEKSAIDEHLVMAALPDALAEAKAYVPFIHYALRFFKPELIQKVFFCVGLDKLVEVISAVENTWHKLPCDTLIPRSFETHLKENPNLSIDNFSPMETYSAIKHSVMFISDYFTALRAVFKKDENTFNQKLIIDLCQFIRGVLLDADGFVTKIKSNDAELDNNEVIVYFKKVSNLSLMTPASLRYVVSQFMCKIDEHYIGEYACEDPFTQYILTNCTNVHRNTWDDCLQLLRLVNNYNEYDDFNEKVEEARLAQVAEQFLYRTMRGDLKPGFSKEKKLRCLAQILRQADMIIGPLMSATADKLLEIIPTLDLGTYMENSAVKNLQQKIQDMGKQDIELKQQIQAVVNELARVPAELEKINQEISHFTSEHPKVASALEISGDSEETTDSAKLSDVERTNLGKGQGKGKDEVSVTDDEPAENEKTYTIQEFNWMLDQGQQLIDRLEQCKEKQLNFPTILYNLQQQYARIVGNHSNGYDEQQANPERIPIKNPNAYLQRMQAVTSDEPHASKKLTPFELAEQAITDGKFCDFQRLLLIKPELCLHDSCKLLFLASRSGRENFVDAVVCALHSLDINVSILLARDKNHVMPVFYLAETGSQRLLDIFLTEQNIDEVMQQISAQGEHFILRLLRNQYSTVAAYAGSMSHLVLGLQTGKINEILCQASDHYDKFVLFFNKIFNRKTPSYPVRIIKNSKTTIQMPESLNLAYVLSVALSLNRQAVAEFIMDFIEHNDLMSIVVNYIDSNNLTPLHYAAGVDSALLGRLVAWYDVYLSNGESCYSLSAFSQVFTQSGPFARMSKQVAVEPPQLKSFSGVSLFAPSITVAVQPKTAAPIIENFTGCSPLHSAILARNIAGVDLLIKQLEAAMQVTAELADGQEPTHVIQPLSQEHVTKLVSSGIDNKWRDRIRLKSHGKQLNEVIVNILFLVCIVPDSRILQRVYEWLGDMQFKQLAKRTNELGVCILHYAIVCGADETFIGKLLCYMGPELANTFHSKYYTNNSYTVAGTAVPEAVAKTVDAVGRTSSLLFQAAGVRIGYGVNNFGRLYPGYDFTPDWLKNVTLIDSDFISRLNLPNSAINLATFDRVFKQTQSMLRLFNLAQANSDATDQFKNMLLSVQLQLNGPAVEEIYDFEEHDQSAARQCEDADPASKVQRCIQSYAERARAELAREGANHSQEEKNILEALAELQDIPQELLLPTITAFKYYLEEGLEQQSFKGTQRELARTLLGREGAECEIELVELSTRATHSTGM